MAENNLAILGIVGVGAFVLLRSGVLDSSSQQRQAATRRQRRSTSEDRRRRDEGGQSDVGRRAAALSGASFSSIQEKAFTGELANDPAFSGVGVTNKALSQAIESPATNVEQPAEIGTDFETALGIAPRAKEAITNTANIVGQFGADEGEGAFAGGKSAFSQPQRIATTIDILQSAKRGITESKGGKSARERRQQFEAKIRELKGRL